MKKEDMQKVIDLNDKINSLEKYLKVSNKIINRNGILMTRKPENLLLLLNDGWKEARIELDEYEMDQIHKLFEILLQEYKDKLDELLRG